MTDTLAQDQLKAYVRRIEALDDEIKVLNEDKSEVYAESKANGFDNKILRKVVAERRKGSAEREEQDALFQLYWDAVHGVVHAHVEIIEEIPPHDADGVIIDHSPDLGKVVTTDPRHGASGAEEETQVATVRASSSAQPSPQPETAGLPEATASGSHSEPASSTPREIAEPGDESAALPSAALVVVSNVVELKKPKTPTFSDPAHRDCLDPVRCGGFSNLKLCQRCAEAAEGGQVA